MSGNLDETNFDEGSFDEDSPALPLERKRVTSLQLDDVLGFVRLLQGVAS